MLRDVDVVAETCCIDHLYTQLLTPVCFQTPTSNSQLTTMIHAYTHAQCDHSYNITDGHADCRGLYSHQNSLGHPQQDVLCDF